MLRRIVGWVVLVPLCLVLIVFALANRQLVVVNFNPLVPSEALTTPGVGVPLFLVLFTVLLFGVVLGGVSWPFERTVACSHARGGFMKRLARIFVGLLLGLVTALAVLLVITLRALAPKLDALGWSWGPTGGAGFALASGLPVLHADSDLDLVLRMPNAPSAAQRDQLAHVLAETECRVDLQIDTGRGGFAWRDWLASPRQTLLKTDHGPHLVADPWSEFA